MKPKIVKFKDGTYGVRKWQWDWPVCIHPRRVFLDLEDLSMWVGGEGGVEDWCKGTLEQAVDAFRRWQRMNPPKGPTDYGKPI